VKKKKGRLNIKKFIKKLKSKETKAKIRKLRKELKIAAKYVDALDAALGKVGPRTKKSGGRVASNQFVVPQMDLDRIFGPGPSFKKKKKFDISQVL